MEMQELQRLKNKYDIIGNDAGLNRALETAVAVAPTDLTVLITGESGVGKETIPQIIHQFSRRKNGKYLAVNCGAIPEGTINAELFGHEKGAFTGAIGERKGYFEEADGGTLFLDEIGNIPLHLQAKLLRAIQNRAIVRVGGTEAKPVDIRLICATNMDLEALVREGRFREDLYYRINTVHIALPALRDRKEDIAPLAEIFLKGFAQKYHRPLEGLDDSARRALEGCRWSGNIRELQNCIEKAVILSDGNVLTAGDLQLDSSTGGVRGAQRTSGSAAREADEEKLVRDAMQRTGGNISAAAAILGVSRPTMYAKLKKYGL